MSLSQKQLKLRQQGLGSSDVVALFPDIAPSYWKSMSELYLSKTGGLPRKNTETDRTRAGHRFEGAIAEEFAERHNVKIFDPKQTVIHRKEPWMMATPDRLINDGKKSIYGAVGVECKNVGEQNAGRWNEGPPPFVLLQTLWQMLVLESNRWWIAGCIGGWDFRFHEVTLEENRELAEVLLARARKFWFDVVIPKRWQELPVDDSEAYRKLLAKQTEHRDTAVTLNDDMEHVYQKAQIAAGNASYWKRELEVAKNMLWKYAGGATELVTARGERVGRVIYRKAYSRPAVDYPESKYFKLSISSTEE